MKTSAKVLFCVLLGVSVSARPQDGYGGAGGAPGGAGGAPGAAGGAPAGGAPAGGITSASFAAAPAPSSLPSTSSFGSAPAPAPSSDASSSSAASFGGGSSSGGASSGAGSSSSGGGSGLSTDCQRQEVGEGKFKFVCSGVNPESISLRSEHVLWLTQDGGKSQVVDIEVPNYKIAELIKAGFKPGSAGDQTINVLLKKPETTVDAQVDKPTSSASKPNVKLSYEPVEKKLVHFPNDKQYSPLQGPILPPLAGGRAQRQVQPQLQNRFIHQFDQPIYSASLTSSYSTRGN